MHDPDWTGSLAYAYLARCRRLSVVVDGITPSAYAWQRLSKEATCGRVRIILASWFRRGEQPRRRVAIAWRFPDKSSLVLVTRSKYPATLEVLSSAGISACIMRDSRFAVAAALRTGHPVYEDLVRSYIALHGALPHLDAEALVGALQADDQAIRLDAMANLTRMAMPAPK
jgi:hypothetical protein